MYYFKLKTFRRDCGAYSVHSPFLTDGFNGPGRMTVNGVSKEQVMALCPNT